MPSISSGSWRIFNLTRKIISLLFRLILVTSYRVDACITPGHFDINPITQADSIYVGTVNNYEIVEYKDVFGGAKEYGLVYFSVKRALKGEGHGNGKFYLFSGNFGLPQDIIVSKSPSIENAAIVAVSGRSIYEKPTLLQRFENGSIFIHQPPNLPQIAGEPCKPVFILPFSPEMENLVLRALRGEVVEDQDEALYASFSEPVLIEGEIIKMRSVIIPDNVLNIITLLLIFLIAMSPIYIIFRWVKRRKSFKAKS